MQQKLTRVTVKIAKLSSPWINLKASTRPEVTYVHYFIYFIKSFRLQVYQELAMALLRDFVRRANFTTKPFLEAKFFAFARFLCV